LATRSSTAARVGVLVGDRLDGRPEARRETSSRAGPTGANRAHLDRWLYTAKVGVAAGFSFPSAPF